MYTINLKKFQNTPRSEMGIAATAEKRTRLPSSAFQTNPFHGRQAFLHPTKGWRQRNVNLMAVHGSIVQRLAALKEQAKHRMILAREERNKKAIKPI